MQESVWWHWHRQLPYSEPQQWQNWGCRSENRLGAVFLNTEFSPFWTTSRCSEEYKSCCLCFLCVSGCTDLFWLRVADHEVVFVSLSHIRRLSRCTHGVWLDNPVLLLSCQRGWSFILAPLCLSVCWYICLLVLEDWMSGGGSVYCSSITQEPVFYFILCHWRCTGWPECCARQFHTIVAKWCGCTGRCMCVNMRFGVGTYGYIHTYMQPPPTIFFIKSFNTIKIHPFTFI